MPEFIDPSREQFDAFKALDRDVPILMLNLIRFNLHAHYEDGTTCSGRAAYATYGQRSGPIFKRVGGKIIWRGNFDLMLIGPTDMLWDLGFVARYPNAGAFMEMVTDEDYRRAVIHRQAAVADSRLMRFSEEDAGSLFSNS